MRGPRLHFFRRSDLLHVDASMRSRPAGCEAGWYAAGGAAAKSGRATPAGGAGSIAGQKTSSPARSHVLRTAHRAPRTCASLRRVDPEAIEGEPGIDKGVHVAGADRLARRRDQGRGRAGLQQRRLDLVAAGREAREGRAGLFPAWRARTASCAAATRAAGAPACTSASSVSSLPAARLATAPAGLLQGSRVAGADRLVRRHDQGRGRAGLHQRQRRPPRLGLVAAGRDVREGLAGVPRGARMAPRTASCVRRRDHSRGRAGQHQRRLALVAASREVSAGPAGTSQGARVPGADRLVRCRDQSRGRAASATTSISSLPAASLAAREIAVGINAPGLQPTPRAPALPRAGRAALTMPRAVSRRLLARHRLPPSALSESPPPAAAASLSSQCR
jgi:hypothetical protein